MATADVRTGVLAMGLSSLTISSINRCGGRLLESEYSTRQQSAHQLQLSFGFIIAGASIVRHIYTASLIHCSYRGFALQFSPGPRLGRGMGLAVSSQLTHFQAQSMVITGTTGLNWHHHGNRTYVMISASLFLLPLLRCGWTP